MFDKEEIKKKAVEFNLNPPDVERDYIQSWIIKEVSIDEYLGPRLTLKGSGALRKLYYPETRFARDLDFSTYSHLDKEIFKGRLQKIGRAIQEQTGVPFVEKVIVKEKNLPEKMQIDALEARMYFKELSSKYKFDLKTQVDLTQGERLRLPAQNRPIIHPYSDSELLSKNKIRCQKLEEIIATKFITLIHRRKPGDLFDLVYSTFISKSIEVNLGQVIRVLLSRTDFANSLEKVRQYFINLPLREKYAQTWSGLLIPAQGFVSFDEAERIFLSSIVTFFDEVSSYAKSFITGHLGGFSDILREKIITAGRQKRLIKITYTDLEREVEPYRLEYYTRESDGKTNEYFWGFDRTGGTSHTVSIKRFLCNKIQKIDETKKEFSPQWDVEL